jgi:PKD repeat protein
MKKLIFIFLLAVALFLPEGTSAQGGPDAYGYTWNTSLNAGGPAYNWIDITTRSGVQTVTGLSDDNSAAGMINIGFSFHFYWTDQTQLKVGSNGWLSFGNVGNIASCFPTIPAASGAADNYLAVLMSDLNFTGAGNPGQVKYWTNSVDSFIISYINVPFWEVNAPGYTGSNTFQVILCKTDSSITYQYGALSGFLDNAACNDLTVGIENSTGTIGLQPHADALPPTNYTIRFDYPAVELISVQDALPEWNYNSENAGELISMNAPLTLLSNIKSGGNANITSPISLQTNIKDVANTVVYSASGSIPSLNSGQDSLFNFNVWTPTVTGSYSFETTTTNSQDINPGNDFNSIELQVIDLCASTTTLSYVSNSAPTGSVNWNGGTTPNSFGAAVYFKPPVYPYTVSALEYYITSNVSDNFVAAVYDDDGPNGTAGTLLFTTTVPAGSVITGWNTVPVSPGVVLNNGGFYVTWYQGGTTIFLGNQNTGPFSHRTYEILSGSWATYRNAYNTDLFIRATISNYTTVPQAGFTSAFTGPSYDYQFSDTTVGLVASWAWDFGDGSTSTLQNPTHTFASAGTYTVCLVATSPCGGTNSICQTVNACIPATVTAQPQGVTVCEGTTSTFSVSAIGDGITYQWQVDNGLGFTNISSGPPYSGESTATLSVVAGNSLNTYAYRAVITGNCGTATSAGAVLSVNTQPNVTLNTFSSVCETETAFALTGESPTGGTFSGTAVSAGSFDPAVAGVGTHSITYIYTDANLCSDTATGAITVDQKPIAAMITFADVCENAGSFVLNNGTPVGGSYSGTGVNAGNFDPAVAGAGTHTITYIAVSGACSDTAQETITVNASPVVTLTPFSTVCADDAALTLSGESPAGGVYSGTGVSVGSFDPAVSGTGTFVITYVYTDVNACSDTAQENIVVDACLGLSANTALGQNSIYPNPSKGLVTVITQSNNALLFVYDVNGKLVKQQQMRYENTNVDLHELTAGIYTFRLQSTETVETFKVVLEK